MSLTLRPTIVVNTITNDQLKNHEIKMLLTLINANPLEKIDFLYMFDIVHKEETINISKNILVGITNYRIFKSEKGNCFSFLRSEINSIEHKSNGIFSWDMLNFKFKNGTTNNIGIYHSDVCKFYTNYLSNNPFKDPKIIMEELKTKPEKDYEIKQNDKQEKEVKFKNELKNKHEVDMKIKRDYELKTSQDSYLKRKENELKIERESYLKKKEELKSKEIELKAKETKLKEDNITQYSTTLTEFITEYNKLLKEYSSNKDIETTKQIPSALRHKVWTTYVSPIYRIGKCFCCRHETITEANYDCGHIICRSDGGITELKNLRAICGQCNKSMARKTMCTFIKDNGFWNDSSSEKLTPIKEFKKEITKNDKIPKKYEQLYGSKYKLKSLLEEFLVPELRELCEYYNIVGCKTIRKDEIIKKIIKADVF